MRRGVYRKTDMVRAIDMRPSRLERGMTADEFAETLGFSDGKHICAIETGKCSVSSPTIVRQAYTFGAAIVELVGVGGAVTLPFDLAEYRRPRGRARPSKLRAGEAAWIALAENREAIDSLESLQAAVTLRDRRALVALYEQIVCDPRHAAELVAEAIDRIDPTIGPEAAISHAAKLMRKGILARSHLPLDAA
jgi:transcriptional regulator with XRE-family HTH domain